MLYLVKTTFFDFMFFIISRPAGGLNNDNICSCCSNVVLHGSASRGRTFGTKSDRQLNEPVL